MHILLTFWVNMSFLKTAPKKLNFQISNFSKIASFYPNLIIFPVKAESSYFSDFMMRA
eukprot:UN24965